MMIMKADAHDVAAGRFFCRKFLFLTPSALILTTGGSWSLKNRTLTDKARSKIFSDKKIKGGSNKLMKLRQTCQTRFFGVKSGMDFFSEKKGW